MCQSRLSVENGSTDHGGGPEKAEQIRERNTIDEAGFYIFGAVALDTLLLATYQAIMCS